MPEVGLVRFAVTALRVSQAALPRYRTKFSKRQFNQPQLLAVLCLMRYEDWTFRETEVRLAEHQELRRALRLGAVPDYTTLYRFLKRLNPDEIGDALDAVVRRMGGKRRGRTVALDATGLAKGRTSSYFIRRIQEFTGQSTSRRHWLKWLAVVDVDRQLILAQDARQAPWNDCASLPRLVRRAARCARVRRVLADAEFDSERNHAFVREELNAESIIPAKRRSSRPASGVRALMRDVATAAEAWPRRSSPPPSESSPAARRAIPSTRRSAKLYCSASPSISTGSGRPRNRRMSTEPDWF